MNKRQRIIDHGEVFTPQGTVSDMLDLVQGECERIDSRFLEPACGNGNFLAEVLRRKLLTVDQKNARNRDKWERDAILAVCSLYGIDLLGDNVAACRVRLLQVVHSACRARFQQPLTDEAARSTEYILAKNIVPGDALTLLMANGQPIVFSEWSPVNGLLIKRRDFRFSGLMEHAEYTQPGSLFSDYGESVYLPEPIGEYPPCHYLKLADAEASHERP